MINSLASFTSILHIQHPLLQFLKNEASSPQATTEALEPFEKLKQTLLSTSISRTPDWEKAFLVFTDASEKRMGAI